VKILIFLLVIFSLSNPSQARVRIACSSNFFYPLSSWKAKQSKDLERVEIVPGATSNLYHQIEHGAPFQIFICSDPLISSMLRKLPNWKRSETLAYGYLIFWSKAPIEKGMIGQSDFSKQKFAISDPKSTPFGRIAKDFLEFEGLGIPTGCIMGDGVQQVNQFIYSGSIDAAISSNSLISKQNEMGGFILEFKNWTLPQEIHLLSSKEESLRIYYELTSERSIDDWKEFHFLIN